MEATGRTDTVDIFRKVMGCSLASVALAIVLLAALVAAAAGFGSRLGVWHFRTGFTILQWGAGFAAASLPAAIAAIVLSVRKRLWFCTAISATALILGAAILSVPLNWKRAAAEAPPIHDITTDLAEPPRFVAILPLRQDAPNPAEYGGASVALAQQSAYPDINTLLLDMPAEQAFPLVQETVKRLGWKVVAAVPEEGRIEATDTTFWFGFTDDIVVRVTPAGHRSLVDIRSVSRVGRSDAGTNAARIRRFLAAFHPRG